VAHLLVVEDDATIGGVLRSSLSAHGHEVTWALTGADALRAAAEQTFDLVLLDLGLPDADGVDVCRALRSGQPGAVVVVLTARDEEIDVVVGLEAGADDYLTKPFRLGELLARIHAHLRRSQPAKLTPAAAAGLLRVDEQTRRAYLGETELPLRAKEFDLLARFLASPGAALSRATLMADVWDPQWFGSTKTLDVHVSSLRSKLAAAAVLAEVSAPAIVAVRAFGYRLEISDPD
jgi:DNA-binding response OmpR family regulator